MSTVIDSLLVLLSLDPSGFKRGSQEADKALKDTEESATKRSKDLEAKAKVAGQVLDRMRNQVLALAGLFTAGIGLKGFVSELTTADAAAGRSARNIGLATETLTAWQGVAERAGGTAAGMTSSLQGLSQQFQQLYLTGQSAVVPYFRAVGVALADATGKARPFDEVLLDLSDKFSKMDPARAQALGRGMGLDEGTVNVLIQGRTAITALLEEQKKLGAANKADADAAAERQKQFNALSQAATDLGRKLLTALTPALLAAVHGLTALAGWFAEHPRVFAAFAGAVGVAAGVLTAALTVLSAKGFLSLIATLLKVPAAAAAADAALATTAATATATTATVGTGLLGLLGTLAKSAGLVAAASGVGYAIGSAIWFAIEGTKLGDKVGDFVTATLAAFGNKEAQAAIEAKLNADAGLGPTPPHPGAAASRTSSGKVGDATKPPPVQAVTPPPSRRAPAQAPAVADAAKLPPVQIVAPERSSQRAPAQAPAAREQAQSDIRSLVGMGWTREQATGIVANIQRESSGNERAVGDNGAAFGLAQWHADRQKEFFKQFGKDIRGSTRDEQLQFINYELRQGNEQSAGRALAQTTDAASAASVIARKYERPADVEGESARRAALATSLLRPDIDPALQAGASTVAAANNTHNVSSSTSHSETHIGKVDVNLPNATDADSVAKGLAPALQKSMAFAQQANTGLTS